MSLFEYPERLSNASGGAISYSTVQAGPDTGSFNNTRLGTGLAQGDTTFTINADPRFVLLSNSYFRIQGHATSGTGTQINAAAGLALADCAPGMMFAQVRVYLSGNLLEESLFFPQTYAATTYASASKNWLKTFGSGEGCGQTWIQRVGALSALPFAALTTQNKFEWCWKPSLSVMSHAQALKAGQMKITFTWSPTAEVNIIGEVTNKVVNSPDAATSYKIFIDEFVLQMCTVMPAPSATLPKTVLLDLTPCRTQLVTYTSATSSTNQNVDVPPSTFRLMFGWQPSGAGVPSTIENTNNTKAAAISSGYTNGISWPLNWFGSLGLSSFQWNAADLAISMPNPIYTPNAYTGQQGTRMYRDFCDATQGTELDFENGSVALGTADSSAPVPLWSFGNINGGATAVTTQTTLAFTNTLYTNDVGAAAATAGVNAGNVATSYSYPNLGDTYKGTTSTYLIPTYQVASELAGNSGYLGRQMLLAFPVVKPPGAPITRIYVQPVHTSSQGDGLAAGAYNMYVFAMYHSAAAIHYNDDGTVRGCDIQING